MFINKIFCKFLKRNKQSDHKGCFVKDLYNYVCPYIHLYNKYIYTKGHDGIGKILFDNNGSLCFVS